MLDSEVIKPTNSALASVPILISKASGSLRWCIDYRALNKVTRNQVFPLSLVYQCLDTLTGNVRVVWTCKDENWFYGSSSDVYESIQLSPKRFDLEDSARI